MNDDTPAHIIPFHLHGWFCGVQIEEETACFKVDKNLCCCIFFPFFNIKYVKKLSLEPLYNEVQALYLLNCGNF